MREARQVFLDACQKVAAALEPEGFRWRKSTTDLVRKEGELKFTVRFQSSTRNALSDAKGVTATAKGLFRTSIFADVKRKVEEIYSFGSVAFIAQVAVEDQRIEKWRKSLSRPVSVGAVVASTNIGYLAAQNTWLDVNLASPRSRDKRIRELIQLVRDAGFPYFAQFRRPRQIVEGLTKQSLQGMLEFGEVEYAVFYGSREIGRRVIERCLRQWPGSDQEYEAAVGEYRATGIPEWWDSKAGARLAKAAMLLGIEP